MAQADIERLLAEVIGLEPASVGESALDRCIRSRMRACGDSSSEAYMSRLRRSPEELQQLIEEVVVPETWFFRDAETFAALSAWAVRRLLDARPDETQRILSVGCCTGEEPYSIAMCLLDAGMAPGRFEVHALDISRNALKHAAQAVYRQKSFRTEDLGFRDRYFRPTADGYRIVPGVRDAVKFVEKNILEVTPDSESAAFNVIFCRNVLIYFDLHSQQRAIDHIRQRLAPKGILFTGAAESFLILQNGFVPAAKSRGFLQEPARIPPAAKTPANARKAILPFKFKAPPAVPDAALSSDLNEAARLANAGRLPQAEKICRSYLQQKGPSAQAYYLLGLIADAMNRADAAAENYKKALYLEPDYIDALSQLALRMDSAGDKAAAARLRDRIARARARALK